VSTPHQVPLQGLFVQLLSDRPATADVNLFIEHCRRIAVAYLRRRSRLGRLRLDQFDLSEEDLALDCLADLFRRDEAGAFVQLRAYAGAINWERLDGPGLEIAVRRLVFSAVNEGLFRRYRENDPVVGRFIRTLKRHVKRHDALVLTRERAVLMVALREAEPARFARAQMPGEVLEAFLHGSFDARTSVPSALVALTELFQSHADYAPRIALSDLALSIRSVLVRRSAADPPDEQAASESIERSDMRDLAGAHVERALEEVEDGMRALYVEKRAIPPALYGAYFQAIRDILTAQFVDGDDANVSFRSALDRYVGGLSSKEYRRQHQAVLEYLINLTKRRFLQRVTPLFA
jgi:hypothetical protein